jgi:hypothetical protein
MAKKEFYRLAINITPDYCAPITYTVTINEPFEVFMKRQSDKYQKATLILCMPCTEIEYRRYKKYNPSNETFIKYKNG